MGTEEAVGGECIQQEERRRSAFPLEAVMEDNVAVPLEWAECSSRMERLSHEVSRMERLAREVSDRAQAFARLPGNVQEAQDVVDLGRRSTVRVPRSPRWKSSTLSTSRRQTSVASLRFLSDVPVGYAWNRQ